MKTKEQILKWLDKQPWKNEFYEEFFKDDSKIICYNENFIRYAFDWHNLSHRELTWKPRDEEYRKWYNSDDKPMSWEEYCEQNPSAGNDWYINNNCGILTCIDSHKRDCRYDANVMPRELCEAFVAYMKLIQLRNAWIKDCTNCITFAKITTIHNSLTIMVVGDNTNGLSFYSKDIAQEFIDTFKDLLETAKPLL